MEILVEIVLYSWEFFVESAPWLLLGFLAAGLLHGFVSESFVGEHLARGRITPVFKAALIGIPLPLCSCGVLPAAMGLRGKGATKSATVSFMVSTPETGVDSIAVTLALLGPFMAVARPLAATFSAIFAGLVESLFEERRARPVILEMAPKTDASPVPPAFSSRIAVGLRYAFGDLLKDLTPWLLLGLLIGGAISALVPEGWIGPGLGSGWYAKFAMLLLGVPMYVCATASTPIAAALLMKGISPGAALVFLLTGPATNTASLVAMTRMMGLRTTARYLASISAGALAAGWMADLILGALPAGTVWSSPIQAAEAGSPAEVVAAAALLLLIARAYLSKRKPAEG